MGDIRELKDFTRGQLDAALLLIGDKVGMGTAEGIKALLAGRLTVCAEARLRFVDVVSLGATIMVYHELLLPSTGAEIITQLGGEVNAETTEEEINILKEKQKNREVGVLLTGGEVNIFFVRKNGVLWMVIVRWYAGDWDVNEFPPEYGRRWSVDSQVFFRNSVFISSGTLPPASA